MPLKEGDQPAGVLLLVEDLTELLFLQERVEVLKQSLEESRSSLEKTSLDAKEANQQLVNTLKVANDRSVEIEVLTQNLRELKNQSDKQETHVSTLLNQVANLRTNNESLLAELHFKQTILEEVTELLRRCHSLEELVALIENRTKVLFKLDSTCLHVFRTANHALRVTEILDTRKASPRLLDLPRKNPRVLDPVLQEGQPVVIKAEVHSDKSAAMSISQGPLHRLVAYIPLRHQDSLLGMMMLDRFGTTDAPEKMLGALTTYLGHAALALSTALACQEAGEHSANLTTTIAHLETRIKGLGELISIREPNDATHFARFLRGVTQISEASDSSLLRLLEDGTFTVLASLDGQRDTVLRPAEEKIVRAIRENPQKRSVARDPGDTNALLGFPLTQGARLIGVLFLTVPDLHQEVLELLELAARLASDHLSISIFREEKELWENFYKSNLSA
jgi:GAF domain-containing protein